MSLLAASEAIPDSVDEVKSTLLTTLGGLWESFLERTPFLAVGLILIFVTWAVSGIAGSIVEKMLKRRRSMRASFRQLLLRFLSIAVWGIGLLITAMVVFPGLSVAKALGGLGLLSVAVGLAFKDIFENFFAGILILWRFPFEKGDFIECEGIVGRVENVEIRMSRIRRTTGELVVLPNSFLFSNPVEVLTSEPTRRVHLATGVGYGEDVAESVKVIRAAVESCKSVVSAKPVEIYPTGFGDSSIDIDVAWWTDSKPGSVRESKAELVTAIKGALDAAGIEIPFPYRTLTFSEPLTMNRDHESESSGS